MQCTDGGRESTLSAAGRQHSDTARVLSGFLDESGLTTMAIERVLYAKLFFSIKINTPVKKLKRKDLKHIFQNICLRYHILLLFLQHLKVVSIKKSTKKFIFV